MLARQLLQRAGWAAEGAQGEGWARNMLVSRDESSPGPPPHHSCGLVLALAAISPRQLAAEHSLLLQSLQTPLARVSCPCLSLSPSLQVQLDSVVAVVQGGKLSAVVDAERSGPRLAAVRPLALLASEAQRAERAQQEGAAGASSSASPAGGSSSSSSSSGGSMAGVSKVGRGVPVCAGRASWQGRETG